MVGSHGRFVWYELMTTDMEAAKAFYAEVVGWDPRDAYVQYPLYTVHGRRGPGERADAPVGRREENGSDAELARICRRR